MLLRLGHVVLRPRCHDHRAPGRILQRKPFSVGQNFTVAVTRDLPSSFSSALTEFAQDDDPIDLSKATQQKAVYVRTLRKFVPTICMPALDEHPDSVFVEDTVVAVGNRAVITNPGHVSRRGEVDTIKDLLIRLGMQVTDMREVDPTALCDGGDVMYTGKHLFVGLSKRTNEAALAVLSDGLSIEETHAVSFSGNALHLKSIVTHIDSSTLLAPVGDLGNRVLDAMDASAKGYKAVRLPNMLACNVVSVNGGVLAQDAECSESRRILQEVAKDLNIELDFVNLSEVAKVDGALTCCSVLLQIDDFTKSLFPKPD